MVINRESVKYSLKNLAKRKTRSFLTILSIFIGIATIFIFISFGLGLYNYIEEMTSSGSTNKLIIQSKGVGAPGLDDTFKLTDDDIAAIKKVPGVFEVTGLYFKVAEIQQNKNRVFTFLVAYNPKKPFILEIFDIGVESGRELKNGDKGKVILGYNYQIPDKIFPKAYKINEKINIQGEDLRVIGFFESVGNPQDDAQIYIINDHVDELYPEENSYGWIIAEVDEKEIESIVEKIEKNLRKERGIEKGKDDFFVQSFEDMIESFSGTLNLIIGFIIFIALISILVSTVNTANTMITSVLERTKEIGIMKSIGAKNSEIFKIFLFESIFLGFVAGIIGVVVGFGVSFAGGIILKNLGWGFLSPYFSPWLFIGLIIFSTITGAISGVIPAINASKINIVDTLRYE